ncbi:hypothetical protein HPB47_026038 [Ixodes persulcatus]|uniref:Uncharacterized protein n=1 Tax=Ixodes persulcatus TaxID=34615 RepID=A0AC60PZR4_IXOPE|nr:hypothetical protein HPB47_026038 [Ixodes persulcatus]
MPFLPSPSSFDDDDDRKLVTAVLLVLRSRPGRQRIGGGSSLPRLGNLLQPLPSPKTGACQSCGSHPPGTAEVHRDRVFIAPVPIPETHVEPNEKVERSPDDSESGMRVSPGGSFGVHVPGSEIDNTAADTDILAAAMSAAEIDTETGPCDSAAKQLTPPPEVHPLPPMTNPVQAVEPVPSTETLLGLIFQGSSEEAAWAFQRLPENIQHKLNGLGIESSWTEPPQPGVEWRHRNSYYGWPRRTDDGGQQRA